MAPRKHLINLVLAEIDVSGDRCVLWPGRIHKNGYGQATWNGKRNQGSHRIVYEIFHGVIPVDMTVDHLCFVTTCVNPRHLTLATSKENRERQRSALREVCVNGHEFTDANTYFRPQQYRVGKRQCRACNRERVRQYRIRVRSAA